ncbi:hypothetical protein ACFLU6_14965 [Acidobacteriota bacterium]
MDTKKKLRIVLGNLFLFAALFGLITLNKALLRPQLNNSEIGQILTGSLPNFLAAVLISLAFVNAILVKKPKHGRRWIYLIAFLVFAILTLEEFKPIWGASTHYDSFDVLASGFGSFVAIIIYEIEVR